MPAHRTHRWRSSLNGEQRRQALAAATDVGGRICDLGRVESAVRAAAEQTHYPRTARWVVHDVAQGIAGLALLCGQLDRCLPDAGWDLAAHDLLSTAVSDLDHPPPPSLFSGLAGLGFVAHQLSRDGSRYQRLSESIDEVLVPQTLAMARSVRERHGQLAVWQFDAISGLAGLGAYLLTRRASAPVEETLSEVLETLVDLVSHTVDGVPAWVTPRNQLADAALESRFPHGALNCGLAHGIPGPLAVMALAVSGGVEVLGLRAAVDHVAGWLLAHRRDDQWGINWPTMVGLPDGAAQSEPSSRAAWCYGSPGVARALWLAGDALGDAGLCETAIQAMEAVYRRPLAARNIDSPTLCHGVAGLLQITLRFGHDTGAPVFDRAAADLTDQLLGLYAADSMLGFCSIEPDGTRVDQAGMLDGAPGVALALLAAATDVPPAWDRMLLLT